MAWPKRVMSTERSAYFLVGSTAVGKTAVAQWIAGRDEYRILSADSMLIYRGMDICTDKPSESVRAGVCYDGIDMVGPDEESSVPPPPGSPISSPPPLGRGPSSWMICPCRTWRRLPPPAT